MTVVFLLETKHVGSQWNNIFKKVLKGKKSVKLEFLILQNIFRKKG